MSPRGQELQEATTTAGAHAVMLLLRGLNSSAATTPPEPERLLPSVHLLVSCKGLSLAKPELEGHCEGVEEICKAFQPVIREERG